MYDDKKAKAYVRYLARRDQKYNFYFTPFVDLSQKDRKRKPFSHYYSDDYGCYYECYINGKEIRFTDNMKRGFGISLKPGKYTIKVIVHINHAVGNVYESDMNFRRTSFSDERWIMYSPYWTKRKFEKIWNIEIGENTSPMYFGFEGYLNGSFVGGYNKDYYHRKYNDYEELIFTLDYLREDFWFFESTKEEIERIFDYYVGVVEFDYSSIDISAYNELLLELGEYPGGKSSSATTKTTTSTITKVATTPKQTISTPKSNEVTKFEKIKTISSHNAKYINVFSGSYYGNVVGNNPHGLGICWKKDKAMIGFFENGWPTDYGIEIDTNTFHGKIYDFQNGAIQKTLMTIDDMVFPPYYSSVFDEEVKQFTNGIYSGKVFENKANNFGSMLYKNGSYYVGEWLNGAPCGFGIYVCDKNITIGQYSKGVSNGYSITIYSNGNIEYGKYVSGVLSKK